MAASSSRQPHRVPLPPSPTKNTKSGKGISSRKGKGKENVVDGVQQPLADSDDLSLPPNSSWDWTYLTDSSASKVPPIFTKDGSYFFSLVGSSVKIHSVITGQVVSTLSAPRSPNNDASSDVLTSAILNPHNAFQLITSSLDGRLVVWDFLDAALLQIIDIAQPIHHICAHKAFKDTVFVAASKPGKKSKPGADDNAAVLRVSLKPVANTTKSAEILAIGKTRLPTGLSLSPSGTWLIATASHKVHIAKAASPSSGFVKYVSPERLTCLAFHPHEEYFATGDDKGFIRLWYCLNDDLPFDVRGVEKKTQTTALHWHAHAVSSLAFTTNGAYLLSGGEEAVLVIWQLHTGKKEFVPRVGAPISTISVLKSGGVEEEYLLGLADATYSFVSSGSLKISRSYSRIKLDPAAPFNLPSNSGHRSTPLAVHATSSTLILPSSHSSSLQIYSPSSSKLISELEVSPSNRVSRRDQKPIEQSRVEHVAVSPSGAWFASIDTREGDDNIRSEIYLKIWSWDSSNSRWVLNTRIDRPHGLSRITSISFSPAPTFLQLVTTGEDGNVRLWRPRTLKNKTEVAEEFWTMRSSFSFRSQVPRSASWSGDGSLLAVTFGQSVAIYDPVSTVLRRSLMCTESRDSTSAHFVGKQGRCLAAVGAHDLVLWDLVTQSVRWIYNAFVTIDRVISHDQQDTFTVFHANGQEGQQRTRAAVFSPTSSRPLATYTLPFGLRNCLSYPLQEPASNSTLVGVTDDWGVVLIGNDLKLAKEEGTVAREIVMGPSNTRRTLFQDIFGKSAFEESSTAPVITERQNVPRINATATEVFDRPAYLLPPLEQLFEPLVESFLRPRPEESDAPAVPEDEDVDMEEEAVEPVLVGTQRNRIVRPEEMSVMIELFRKHTVKGPPATNGIGHGADKFPPQTFAASPAPKILKNGSAPKPPPVSSPPKPPPTPSPSIVTANGRKRKKSSSS